MIVQDVVVLDDAADDLTAGRIFYDQREAGVGEYFWDSLVADIESLFIFAGVHVRHYGYFIIGCWPNGSRMQFITRLMLK